MVIIKFLLMKQIIKISKTLSMMSFILLAGCGGRSGGTSEEIITPIVAPPPVNNAPSCSTTDYPNLKYCTVQHLDLDREFYVYIPDGLNTPITLAPLLFNLHGYRRQALDFLGYSGFQSLADEDSFIVIYPQGSILPSTGQPHWNDSGWTSESPANDIDFISSLIDWAYAEYQIDLSRVYATGKSNGGKMSYHLACNLGYRIAGVASVGGSMTPNTYATCSPNQPTAIVHIHGRDDTVVPIDGNGRSTPLTDMIDYWKNYNGCDQETVFVIPDLNDDGYGGSLYRYHGCLNNVDVQLFLMDQIAHDWPTDLNDYDIIAADEIWNFLEEFDINGRIAQ